MSPLATAPRRATPEPDGTTAVRSTGRFGANAGDPLLAVVLAAGFTLIVFVATGGNDLGPNTWVEIALLAVGAAGAVALALLVRGRPVDRHARAWGIATVALFAALAALTYLSIAWSVQPATSWVEANRTLAYLAAFGAATALARLAPGRWPAVLGAIGVTTVVVCGYALLAKVFPATLNASDPLGRLRVPFDYWNATGLMAGLGLPVCLWAGTRPATGRVLRSLSVPAVAMLLTTLILSYSRGALLAAGIGLGCWFIFVPLRLRATLLLALGAVGGALASAWALRHPAISHDNATLAARTATGHDFGIVLLVLVALGAAVGFAAIIAMDRVALPGPVRRRIGIVLLIGLAMMPVVAIAGAAASSRGLTGEISHVWHTLTSTTPSSSVGNNPGRIAQLSNSRPLYWSEGLKVGEHAPLAGVGAGGFGTARPHYNSSPLEAAHAHNYLIETFADLGLIGVALTLALFGAWALAARRTLAGAAADTVLGGERNGMLTMLSVVVIFGVSSLIDWTWFIPGVTVPALVCAGWLAGRGPLPTAEPATGPVPGIAPGRAAAVVGILAALVIAGWFVWQPLRSADSVSAAITEIGQGQTAAAITDARSAADSDPVSVDPLWELSAIYASLGDQAASRHELVKATQIQPSNWQTWQQLAAFDLQAHHTRLALAELATALRLDRTQPFTRLLIQQAHEQQAR